MSRVLVHVNKEDDSSSFMAAIGEDPATKSLIEAIDRAAKQALGGLSGKERSDELLFCMEELSAYCAQICASFTINRMRTDAECGKQMANLHARFFHDEFLVHWARMAPMIDQMRTGTKQ